MRVIICGSPEFDDWEYLRDKLDHYLAKVEIRKLVIMTAARHSGVEPLAETWAFKNKVTVERYHPDPDDRKNGGRLRDEEMMKSSPDCLVAFSDGGPETTSIIARAEKAGLKVKVFLC